MLCFKGENMKNYVMKMFLHRVLINVWYRYIDMSCDIDTVLRFILLKVFNSYLWYNLDSTNGREDHCNGKLRFFYFLFQTVF